MNTETRLDGPRAVLMLTPSVRLLGARRSLLALARGLDKSVWRPVVLAKEEGVLTEKLRQAGVDVRLLHFRPYRKGKFFIFRPFTIRRLIRIAREEGAALLHCNEIYPNPYAVAAARALSIPVITHMRLSVTPRMIRNYLLDRADRIIVVSDGAGADFDLWPDKARRVTTVYNGLDPDEFSPPPGARSEWRARLGAADGETLFGMLGLISARKQQHVAIAALARLRDAGRPARLAIIGEVSPREGAYLDRIRDLIGQYGLMDQVTFHPFVDDPAPVFSALDVNLLISNDEGFGRVIIEAGFLGIPSIGTRVGGIPELIQSPGAGLLVPSGDVDALAQAMTDLMDTGRRQAMGEAMRRTVEAQFTIAEHVRRMEAVYRQVLEEKKK